MCATWCTDKGSDTLRVTSSIRNVRLASRGCRWSGHPRSQWEMPPSQAAGSMGPILLLVPCGTDGLRSTVWVAVCFSSPSSSSPQQGQHLSVCPPVVSAFSRTPKGHEWVAAALGGRGRLVFRRSGRAAGVCCPEWPSSHRSRTAACGWGASAVGACCGRP